MSQTAISLRLGERTTDHIDLVVERHDAYSSTKNFCERAANQNIADVAALVAGTEDIRRFIRELRHLDGINEELDDKYVSATIGHESLTKRTKVSLTPETLGILGDIQSSTDLSASKILRICILKELDSIADEVFEPPLDERIHTAWTATEDDLLGQLVELKAILERRFVWQRRQTADKLRSDPQEAEKIAQYYQNYFIDSQGYELIRSKTEDKILECIENVLY